MRERAQQRFARGPRLEDLAAASGLWGRVLGVWGFWGVAGGGVWGRFGGGGFWGVGFMALRTLNFNLLGIVEA